MLTRRVAAIVFPGERLSIARVVMVKLPGAFVMRPANVMVFVMAKLGVALMCVFDALASIWRTPSHQHDAAVIQHGGALGAGRFVSTEKAGEDAGISGFAEHGLDIQRPVWRSRYFDSQLRG